MTLKSLTPEAREALLVSSLQRLLDGELSEGQVLARLRKNVLGMNQSDYANLVGISRRTLSAIENDSGNQSVSVINTAFKPFSLRIGLLPTQRATLEQVLENGSESI